MIAFIDDHREAHGVEPICKVLPIAPSTYHDHVAKRRDPARLSIRAKRDEALKVEVRRVFEENFRVYGVRKVWRQLRREGFDIARCTVSRLMRQMGLERAIRGKTIRTTVQDKAAACPLDHVNRVFHAPAPNTLWLSDFTYVSTWSGFVYVAFVIDAYARRIVGWRVSRTAHTSFVLDALEQALHERRPAHRAGLCPAQGECRIVVGACGGDGIAEHCPDRAAKAARGLKPAAHLDLAQHGEHFRGADLGNGPIADERAGKVEKPFRLLESCLGAAFPCHLREQFVGDCREGVAGGDCAGKLLHPPFHHRVLAVAQQRSRRFAAPARFGKGDLGIEAGRELLLLAVVTVGQLPIFRTVGMNVQLQPAAVRQLESAGPQIWPCEWRYP